MFAVASETGWPEERVLFMPLARLAQYQHCLLRRNGVRTLWLQSSPQTENILETFKQLRGLWMPGQDRELLDLRDGAENSSVN